jgi:2-C-methyl-D-erythritol 4-phosphate cytidylyltransferase
MKKEKFTVLLPGAGSGERMKIDIPKQYIKVAGKTIAQHTIDNIKSHNRVGQIIVAVAKNDKYWQNNTSITTVIGGNTRSESVLNLLKKAQSMPNSSEWVMVHDLVRPCVSHNDIDKLIDAIESIKKDKNSGIFDGAILTYKATDSMKYVENEIIKNSIDRNFVHHALTPQMFRIDGLIKALELSICNNTETTDESSVALLAGGNVKAVESSYANIKLTFPENLSVLKNFLENTT